MTTNESTSDGLVIKPTHTKIWNATMSLRWRKPDADPIVALLEAMHMKESRILQQAFVEIATGEVEWRDVPTAP
jgi:hypothetical protein